MASAHPALALRAGQRALRHQGILPETAKVMTLAKAGRQRGFGCALFA